MLTTNSETYFFRHPPTPPSSALFHLLDIFNLFFVFAFSRCHRMNRLWFSFSLNSLCTDSNDVANECDEYLRRSIRNSLGGLVRSSKYIESTEHTVDKQDYNRNSPLTSRKNPFSAQLPFLSKSVSLRVRVDAAIEKCVCTRMDWSDWVELFFFLNLWKVHHCKWFMRFSTYNFEFIWRDVGSYRVALWTEEQ